ncbi:MAG: ABC transporter permease, partial [Candidatus Bathyarchaeota archaeon]|nr:ABC transporter permease [Candidatus Bathyarchaeota archaeon]
MVLLEGLMTIVIKEIKELARDPKILLSMIVVPLIMFPLMGFAIQTSMESAEQRIEETSIAIINQDQGPVSLSFENYLALFNFTITSLDEVSLEQAINQIQDTNITNLIIIPEGFSQNITDGKTGSLTVYTPFEGGGGIASASQSSAINSIFYSFRNYILDQRIQQGFP